MPELRIEHLSDLESELEKYIDPKNIFGFRKSFIEWVAIAWSNAGFYDTEIRDTGFDRSSFPVAGNVKLKEKTKNYCDFINANTGNSMPTFNSGSGMRCETFEEKLHEFFGEKCSLFVDKYIDRLSLTVPKTGEFSHCDSVAEIIWGDEMDGCDDIIMRFGCLGHEVSPYLCEMNGFDSYAMGLFGNCKIADFKAKE